MASVRIVSKKGSSPTRVVFTGEFRLDQATEAHRVLVKLLKVKGNLTLDCAGVTGCDLTFLQLLIALCRSLSQQKRTVQFLTSPPDCMADLAGALAVNKSSPWVALTGAGA